MAMIKKDGNFMGLPMNIARGNPIPLDKSEIWYSYEEMLNYAANDPVAYVGQILGLVNEADNTAKAYIILNTDGKVQEVGKATMVDNATIILDNDDTLSLKDFGKKYYRYVAEENGVAAHYEEQIVDENHPWTAGLEPRVVLEGTKFVLGWYQPNPTTIEGVNNQVAGLQTSVSALTITTNNLSERVNNTYTKSETDTAIAEKVAAAAHLKREIVEELPTVENAKENIIYMVSNGLTDNDNKYYEYIFIDGVFEPVGTWEVDLEDYATKEEVNNNFVKIVPGKALADIEELDKLLTVQANAEENYISSVSSDFKVTTDGSKKLELVSVSPAINLASNISLLDAFVKKDKTKDLVSLEDIQKLTTIQSNAEKNIINSVEEAEFSIDENRKLSLISIDGSKISNLTSNTEYNTVKIDLITVQNDVSSINSSLSSINSTLITLDNKFNNYVLSEAYNKDMEDVWDALTWHEL